MQRLFVISLLLLTAKANGQSFSTYTDTAHHFSIQIPTGWKYGVNKNYPELLLIAQRTPVSSADTVRDNFNINTIETPHKNLDKTFSDFLSYLPDARNFKLIATGDTTINGTAFKWLIETHANENSNIQMHNYDFVTVKNGKTYILTMVTFSYVFDAVKPLFDSIAGSFTLL